MSVREVDAMKHWEERIKEKKQTERPVQVIQQVEIDESMMTGDDRLDKLIRSLANSILAADKHILDVQAAGIVQLVDLERLKCQVEFFYTKGKLDAYKECAALPKQIIAEEKMYTA